MAKRYKYTTNIEYAFSAFGVFVCPHLGTVETTWKVPVKYHDLSEVYIDAHFDAAIQPAIRYKFEGDNMLVRFTVQISFRDVFSGLNGSNLDMYNQIIRMRNEAINAAAYQVVRFKENFQDAVRARFYSERMIKNPSIP